MAFVLATILFAGAFLFMVINPVSYIGSYHAEMEVLGFESELTYKFKAGNKVDYTEEGSYGGMSGEQTTEMWYYRKGKRIVIMGSTEVMTEDLYNDTVKLYKDMTDEEFETVSFEIGYGELQYKEEFSDIVYKFENSLGALVNKLVMLLAIVSGAGTVVAFLFNAAANKGSKKQAKETQQ